MTEEEIEEFRAWKRSKDKSELEDIFYQLEKTLEKPSGRMFTTIMPSQAYRLLATAIVLLKKEIIRDE